MLQKCCLIYSINSMHPSLLAPVWRPLKELAVHAQKNIDFHFTLFNSQSIRKAFFVGDARISNKKQLDYTEHSQSMFYWRYVYFQQIKILEIRVSAKHLLLEIRVSPIRIALRMLWVSVCLKAPWKNRRPLHGKMWTSAFYPNSSWL